MSFDPAAYAALQAADPAAAAAYLAAVTGTAQQAPAVTPSFPEHTQPYRAPQAQPAQPVGPTPPAPVPAPARGTLAAGMDQGAKSGGYGSFIKFPAQGYRLSGVVARDMTDLDVEQVKEYGTKVPKFINGREVWRFIVALNVPVSAEFPEGKATLSTDKYRLHNALVREMLAKGYSPGEGLHEGDLVTVTRVADAPTKGQPAHDFQVEIARAGSALVNPTVPTSAPVQAPVSETAGSTAPAVNPAAIPGLTPAQVALVAQYTGASA
jgi:hypothetical protein